MEFAAQCLSSAQRGLFWKTDLLGLGTRAGAANGSLQTSRCAEQGMSRSRDVTHAPSFQPPFRHMS